MSVYVENKTGYNQTVSAVNEKEELLLEKEFKTFSKYLDTNQIINSGITKLSDEEYKLLKEKSNWFSRFVADGSFKVHEKAPIGSLAEGEKVALLEAEVNKLKSELSEAKKAVKEKEASEIEKELDDAFLDKPAKSKKGKEPAVQEETPKEEF